MSPARLSVVGVEAVGPYALVRLRRGDVEPGIPGQFFMLRTRATLLPRPMSLCLAPPGELGFLVDPIGPGTRALAELERGEEVDVLGPLGNGFRLDVERPLLVGGGIGVAPFPYLSEQLGGPPASSASAARVHAEAAALVPNAEVVLEPTYVTERLEPGFDVLACGPEPMLEAVARARAGRPARLGGADGVRLRRLLRLRGRDRRAAGAPLRRGPCPRRTCQGSDPGVPERAVA